MSMLQQILDQMFVDQEILDALDEEQKQILFIKMREEQVKRWNAFDEQCQKKEEEDDTQSSRSSDSSRRLHLPELIDDDDDSSVVEPQEDENTLKEELSRIKPWNSAHASNIIQESIYDDADSLFGACNNNSTSHIVSAPELCPKGILKKSKKNIPDNDNSGGDKLSNNTDPNTKNACSTDMLTDAHESNGLRERSQMSPSTSTSNISSGEILMDSSDCVSSSGSEPINTSYGAHTNYSPLSPEPTSPNVFRGLTTENVYLDDSSPVAIARSNTPADATEPMGMNGNYFNENFFSAPRNRFWNMDMQITPPQKNSKKTGLKFRPDLRATHDLSDIDEELTKRQSEIFEKIKEKHQQFDREAEQEAKRAERAWEEQERKAREAEAEIRRIAQRAREQHRQQSLRTSASILPILKNVDPSQLKSALKNLPRPPKPQSRDAIIHWFRTQELPRGTGLDPVTHVPAVWFHGIISRSRADRLLQKKPSGSFLVRISERIWGYTLSYVVRNGNVKHFLIEKIPEGYQFLGINQVVHRHLRELIAFHKISPITVKGHELLRWAVGQVDPDFPDYADLIFF
ncbi:unnamed protein product [Litomosoides sigmodontis]|uniref:SH2 domain-containing protein n=1 Tax=Litomosoides sigmodontis TaxID=42156 RepID=A0A3P6U0C8_LITSI|nr:unnamed protein product [Litomosoides sigmodontis]